MVMGHNQEHVIIGHYLVDALCKFLTFEQHEGT